MPSRKLLTKPEQVPLAWSPRGLVAGVDEAGRGPLAGPVVAAAVILDARQPIAGLADSKKLTALRREKLFDGVVMMRSSNGESKRRFGPASTPVSRSGTNALALT